MNNNELHQVQSAIDQTHAPNTSQSKRVALYKLLEDETSNPFKCKQMGYYFINLTQDRYRLFGYHCIRKMIEKWTSLDTKDKNDLKHLALNLFKFSMNQNKSLNTNLALLKKKISELIVLLATRCWPQDWNNLLPDLFKISQQNPMSLEMLFIVLKELYFIVDQQPQSSNIPERRKKQIKNELMKNSKQIMQIFAVTLTQCYQQIFTSSSAQSLQIQLAQNILSRCLAAIPKFLNQFPLNVVIDSQVLIGLAKILQVVAESTNNAVPRCYDEFYRFSLLSISFFFMRKFTELNTYEISDRIKQEHTILSVWNIEMEIVKHLYTISHRNNNNNKKNSVAISRLDNMMESIMRKLKLFHGLLKKTMDGKNVPLTKSIRDLLLGISECSMKSSHLQIRLRSMEIWSYILSEYDMLELIGYNSDEDKYAQSNAFNSVIIGIMKYVLNHFRVRFHDLASFETEQEWQNSRNTLKTKITRLLQQCFVLCPFAGMEIIGQFTLSVVNCEKDNVHLNSVGHATIDNERYIALDGLCDVYRIIFESSIYYKHNVQSKKRKQNPLQINEEIFDNKSPLLQMTEQLHNILLNWTRDTKNNANDTQLMSRIYLLLAHLLPLYCRKPAYLQVTFEKLLSDFPAPLPLNPGAKDSFDIKCNAVSCKRKIAFSLLHIAKRIPHICVQFMQPIWKKVMQIIKANFSTFKSINNNGVRRAELSANRSGVIMASITDLSQGPVCHLFELLVCISNGLQTAQEKTKVLAELLGDVISNFNSSEIQNVLSDEIQFSKMIQFPMTPKLDDNNKNKNRNNEVLGEEVDERIRFAYHIRTILNIIQSTLTASLLSEGQTTLRDLFHSANLDELDPNESNKRDGADLSCSFPLFSAVFPNVLKLNKLLSSMYTAQFRSLLSPNYHSIIDCLDVKSLYNLYGLKYDELVRKPTQKPKEIIPLEKAVIWIQNVRDYLCRIIAVSSYFDNRFFEHQNAMNMMIESITSHWNELPLSHLAIILKHFFMNFVQLCSPNYYPNIVSFLSQFLSGCFRKLNACWAKQENAFGLNSGNNNIKTEPGILTDRQKSSGLRNECYQEFALRDASQKLWMAIAMCTINYKERGFILLTTENKDKKRKTKTKTKNIKTIKSEYNQMNDFIAANFAENIMVQYKIEDINNDALKACKINKEITLKQDKLVMLMLANEDLCKCLLRGIECSLNWLDNNCHIRVAQVAAKIASFIARYKMQHLYIQCGVIFKETLNALSRNQIGDNQTNAELNILCVAICQSLAPLCSDILLQILQNIPNVTQEDTRNLLQLFTSDPNTHTNASYRQSIKAFTKKYVIGKQNVLSINVVKRETIKREPEPRH